MRLNKFCLYLLFGGAIIFSLSCRVQKDRYYIKQMKVVGDKYNSKISFGVMTPEATKAFRSQSYEEINNILSRFERMCALSPDSIVATSNAIIEEDGGMKDISRKVDSIYLNKAKIRYIKKNNLLSPSKILRENK